MKCSVDEMLCPRNAMSTKWYVDEVLCRRKFFDEMLFNEVLRRRSAVSTKICRPTACRPTTYLPLPSISFSEPIQRTSRIIMQYNHANFMGLLMTNCYNRAVIL